MRRAHVMLRMLVGLGIACGIAGCANGPNLRLGDYFEALEREAREGDPNAQTALAQLYESGGVSIDADPVAARTWYERAAAAGYAPAQYFLGQMLEEGRGIPADYPQAAAWYLRAAERGEPAAQAALGRLYEQGLGVPRNYDRAAQWYQQAAQRWREDSDGVLGVLPRSGNHVPVAADEAAKWMEHAAELGVAQAQYDLGEAYETGRGVVRDLDMAAKWYESAALRGHVPAREALQRLGIDIMAERAAEVPPAQQKPMRLGPPGDDTAALPAPNEKQTPSVLKRGYRLHLASYRTIEDADEGWSRMLKQYGDLLAGLQVEISRVDLGSRGVFWRVQAGPVSSPEQGRKICAEFIRRGGYCQVMAPEETG
ncbi:MAG: hypothetical protein CMM50_12965 [Rhodospirillaceae bacterium]|nr:hypothetical protein [Rhodospirillaceae bacterium]